MTKHSTTDAPALWTLARREPADPAIRDVRRALTWADLERETNQFGRGLEALGLAPGDHVAVVARNHVEFLVAVIGAQRAGMVVTPVKTGWTAAEIAYLLGDADSRAVITDIPAGRDAAAQLGLVVVDFEQDHATWLAGQDDAPLPYDRCGWKMSYTSGTTGRPKGVRLDTSGTTPFTDAFTATAGFAAALHIPRDGTHLVVSRLFHGAPLTFSISTLAAGAPLFVMDRWDAAAAVGHFADGMTSSIMVPTMFRQMLALPDDVRAQLPVPTLQTIVHGGEPCPIGLKQRMIDWLGPVFLEYFGMSEGGMTLATSEEWLERPGTVGRLATSAGIVILDDDDNPLPPNTEGGVYFESAGRGFFYHRDPEKTKAAYRGSAFTAGDIGWVDDDGYLFISGRRADVIVSAGVNIYPAEIETELEGVPGVADLCVVGAPDAERGEMPVAVVVIADGHDPAAVLAALQSHAAEAVATYKRPTRYVVETELPRDDTGKLLRRQVRDAMWGDDSPFAVSRS
jgi:long-chain acyl-CoA synthetase